MDDRDLGAVVPERRRDRPAVHPHPRGPHRVLVHAAPPVVDVTVRDEHGRVVAQASGLARGAEGPMSALVRHGDRIELEDLWPADADVGRLVLLAGGETGRLTSWWHADDRSEWHWQLELDDHV